MAPILIAIVALIALALWLRRAGKRQAPRAAGGRVVKRSGGKYRCVELQFESDACAAVKLLVAKRFLPGEVPEIPVPECDAAKCSCRYVYHDDRRHTDRRNPVAYRPPSAAGGDRRTKRDRRRPPKSK